jgi:hypothetical protein
LTCSCNQLGMFLVSDEGWGVRHAAKLFDNNIQKDWRAGCL